MQILIAQLIRPILFYANMEQFDRDEFQKLVGYLKFDIGFDRESIKDELSILNSYHPRFLLFFQEMIDGHVDIEYLNELDEEIKPRKLTEQTFYISENNFIPNVRTTNTILCVYHLVIKKLLVIFESRQGDLKITEPSRWMAIRSASRRRTGHIGHCDGIRFTRFRT